MRRSVCIWVSTLIVLFGIGWGCEVIDYSQRLPGPFVLTPQFQEVPLKGSLVVYRYFNRLCYQPLSDGLAEGEIPPLEIEITYNDQEVVHVSQFYSWGQRVCLSLAQFKTGSEIIKLRIRSSKQFTISSFEWLTSDKA